MVCKNNISQAGQAQLAAGAVVAVFGIAYDRNAVTLAVFVNCKVAPVERGFLLAVAGTLDICAGDFIGGNFVAAAVEEFDKVFLPKVKLKLPGQLS